MKLQPKTPTFKNPPEQFTGDVWVDALAVPQTDEQRMVVAKVRFAPGARTHWHSHAVGQTLHVTEGVGLVQSRGGEVAVMRPGDTVYTPPGEEHWHGATPQDFMEHLAMLENAFDRSRTTTWLEPVTDQEYTAS